MPMLYNAVSSFRHSNVASKDHELWGIPASLVSSAELELETHLAGHCIAIAYQVPQQARSINK